MKSLILIVGQDQLAFYQDLKQQLILGQFEVAEAADTSAMLAALSRKPLAIVIINLSSDSMPDGLSVAKQLRQWCSTTPVIWITEHSSEEQVITALRAGIDDYFKLPCSCDRIIATIKHFLSKTSRRFAIPPGSEAFFPDPILPLIIGENRQMADIRKYLLKVAATDSSVLITGETGTGKELVAKLIHQYSARQSRPAVCINCAALPDNLLESELFGYEKGAFTGANSCCEGKIQSAAGGTVFFDEIGDMSLYAQAKILRAIESREIYRIGGKHSIPVDFRIIAATNQDLEGLLLTQKFRKDLFFRLNVVRIHLPPLRERKEDIPLLFNYYLSELGRRFGHEIKGISEEVLARLLQYDWPGNVRELKNLVETLLISLDSSWISLTDLPTAWRQATQDDALPERERLLAVLHTTHWNKSKAAQQLNWSRMTLYRKMARYQIQYHRAETELEEQAVTSSLRL